MDKISDFVIENGILIEYKGTDKDVVIPEGVTGIGDYAFAKIATLPDGRKRVETNEDLYSVQLADSVEHIGFCAFAECENLHTVGFSSNLKTISEAAFKRCYNLEEMVLPSKLERIGIAAFFGHMTTKRLEIHSKNLNLPEGKLSVFENPPFAAVEYILFAPHLSLEVLKNHGLAKQAVKTFVKMYSEYDDDVSREYINYIASQKKKLLSLVFENDTVDIVKRLYDEKKITNKNFEKEYLLPAKQCGAINCAAFIEGCFGASKKVSASVNTLWDGTHFSIDGKQLLKYKEEPGCDTYHVPEGTKEICADAFFMPSLRAVFLPESITAIRNGAFVAKGGQPLFVKLPDSLKKLPAEAFTGGFYAGDDGLRDSQKYYYIATSSAKFAEQSSCSTYSKGEQCPVYTGGPLDDLAPKVKASAVKGFLFATKHGFADLKRWEKSYFDHIKSNEKTYLKQAEKNTFLLHLMIQEHLLSDKGAKTLLKASSLQNNVKIKAALLNYQNNAFERKGKNEQDPLSDNSAELKQALKKQARQEEIKKQAGISGIVFVASGDLDNFGFVDEYTGAHDLSDLKAFIEARGGFLRSAVSKKTDFLICNDTSIQTTKVKKAQELGTPIISEATFMEMAK